MPFVTIDDSEVHALADDISRNASEAGVRASEIVRRGGYSMQRLAMVNCPVDTGYLMNSISIDFGAGRGAGGRFQGGLSFDLGPTAHYGGFVELGVPHPWVIRAHPGGTLAFPGAGGMVFAKSVIHPPMAPQPYLRPAFDVLLPGIVHALGELGSGAVSRA